MTPVSSETHATDEFTTAGSKCYGKSIGLGAMQNFCFREALNVFFRVWKWLLAPKWTAKVPESI